MDASTEPWLLLSNHIRAYWAAYILGCAIVAPLVYFTRKRSTPFILYAVEICIYLSIMHVLAHLAAVLAAWFMTNSSVHVLTKEGVPSDAVHWSTPVVKFWDTSLYDPPWFLWMEFGLMAVIVLLVLKYRPLRPRKAKPRYSMDGSRKRELEKYAQFVANKNNPKRYTDEWAGEVAKVSCESRVRRQSGTTIGRSSSTINKPDA